MRGHAQNDRLIGREFQTRGWAAPMPDFTAMPRANEANRVRMEWDTRDTASNRYWEQIQSMGPTAVTPTMLAAHPTSGAQPMTPTAGRLDHRQWSPAGGAAYFSGSQNPAERPRLPPQSLWQNAYLDGHNVEDRNTARELKATVREEGGRYDEDVSVRIAGRQFSHQWAARGMGVEQIAAAERLRPGQDDFRMDFSGAQSNATTTGMPW